MTLNNRQSGFQYLSDEDKEKIAKSREPESKPGVSKAPPLASTLRPITLPTPPIDIHIAIHTYSRNGGEFHLEGDVYNQDDLAKIHERFKDYMPRKKLFGII